ncbi:MAG: RNA polymerase sigma factor [Candidatus Symbiothrix sp.]|jgi:RNA polymerase sigma-70 factor (ECF subfamily)|nr:RNA polymerase sigma factor [Candidatus Symbiothrix sp.]
MKQETFRNKILPIVDKLFRLAFSIMGNRQDAEDVVQDALFKIWKKKEEWDKIDNLEAYCYRSTRNIALDKLALKDNRQSDIDEDFDLPEVAHDAQERMEEAEQMQQIENALAGLPEKQRTIFHLREIEELSYKQIAEQLDITEDQVKVGLFRARQKLKTILKV